MKPKTYTVELTAAEIQQIYCFLRMSWATPESEPLPEDRLDKKITALWEQIEKELEAKTCQTCRHDKLGYGCKIYKWHFPPEHPACKYYHQKTNE